MLQHCAVILPKVFTGVPICDWFWSAYKWKTCMSVCDYLFSRPMFTVLHLFDPWRSSLLMRQHIVIIRHNCSSCVLSFTQKLWIIETPHCLCATTNHLLGYFLEVMSKKYEKFLFFPIDEMKQLATNFSWQQGKQLAPTMAAHAHIDAEEKSGFHSEKVFGVKRRCSTLLPWIAFVFHLKDKHELSFSHCIPQ